MKQVLSHNPLLNSKLEIPEENLGSRIRNLLGLKQKILRSPFPIIQLKLIPLDQGSSNQFDFMASKPSPWAGMSATTKLHLRLGSRRKLVLVFIFGRGLSKLVKAQAVEFIRIWIDCGVERDGI